MENSMLQNNLKTETASQIKRPKIRPKNGNGLHGKREIKEDGSLGRSSNIIWDACAGRLPTFGSNEKVRTTILEGMRLGLPYQKLAALAGVQVGTLKDWVETAKEQLNLYNMAVAENGGVEPTMTQRNQLWVRFGADISAAEADAEYRHLQVIRDCAIGQDQTHEVQTTEDAKGSVVYTKNFTRTRGKNWAASAWFLERRFPEQYAKKRMLADGELPPGIDMETLRLAALLKQLPKMELERVRDVVKSAFQPKLVDVTDVAQDLPHSPVEYDEMNKQVEHHDNSCQQREAEQEASEQPAFESASDVDLPAAQADMADDHVIESSPADVRTRLRHRMGSELSFTPKSQVAGVKADSSASGEEKPLAMGKKSEDVGMGKWNFTKAKNTTRVRKSI